MRPSLRIAQISRAFPRAARRSMDPGAPRRVSPRSCGAARPVGRGRHSARRRRRPPLRPRPIRAPASPAAALPPTARATPIPAPLRAAGDRRAAAGSESDGGVRLRVPLRARDPVEEPSIGNRRFWRRRSRSIRRPPFSRASEGSFFCGFSCRRRESPSESRSREASRSDLDSAAVAAVRQWRFEPAQKAGVAGRGVD